MQVSEGTVSIYVCEKENREEWGILMMMDDGAGWWIL